MKCPSPLPAKSANRHECLRVPGILLFWGTLALAWGLGCSAAWGADPIARPTIDDAQAAARGIRKLIGTHLTLYTDLPSRAEVDGLPEAFDQAVPQWCQYFGIDPGKPAGWHVTAFLMKDAGSFEELGLLPKGLPPFDNGFNWGDLVWVRHQTSDYYERHLLLHEGTHSFMQTLLGSCGPTWYKEGIAELLATHRWQEGRLTLNWMPPSSQAVPMWGRIGLLRKAVAAGRTKSLDDVIARGTEGNTEAESYAWCWALAALLDGNPAYRERYRQLPRWVAQADFNERFDGLFAKDRTELSDQWQVFLADLEYGDDVARSAIVFAPGEPLPAGGATVSVAADRGWQSSRIRLEAGRRYQLRATGRYQVAKEPQIWWCEPNGVSIRYYHGRPLGQLLAALRPDDGSPDNSTPLVHPIAIGLGASFTAERTGTLYFRINDTVAELGDNAGSLHVEIHEAP